jgi:hypothetical protein
VIVSIHQPGYFPWLGLIEKIALSDRFVILDNVQFNARAFQHRTLYSTDHGTKYLTLPVHSSGHQEKGTMIRDIPLADCAAPSTHYRTLAQRYGKRPGWTRAAERVREILHAPGTNLLDIDLATLELTLSCFEITTEVLLASSLPAVGRKNELILSLTGLAGGTTYLSGEGARSYMEPDAFAERGVDLVYQDFRHPRYAQSHSGDFQPGCLAIEWFFESPDEAATALRAHVAEARHRIGLAQA